MTTETGRIAKVLGLVVALGLSGYWLAGTAQAAFKRNQTASAARDVARVAEASMKRADETLAAVVTSAEVVAGSRSFEDAQAFAEASAGYFEDRDSAAVIRAFGSGSNDFWGAARGAADALDAYNAAFVSDAGDVRDAAERQQEIVATAERMMGEVEAGRERLDEMTVVVRRAFDTDPETGKQMYEALDVETGRAVVLLAAPGTIRPGWSGRTRAEYVGPRDVAVAVATSGGAEWQGKTFGAYVVETEIDRAQLFVVGAQVNEVRDDLQELEDTRSALETRYQNPFVETVRAAAEQIRVSRGSGGRRRP